MQNHELIFESEEEPAHLRQGLRTAHCKLTSTTCYLKPKPQNDTGWRLVHTCDSHPFLLLLKCLRLVLLAVMALLLQRLCTVALPHHKQLLSLWSNFDCHTFVSTFILSTVGPMSMQRESKKKHCPYTMGSLFLSLSVSRIKEHCLERASSLYYM